MAANPATSPPTKEVTRIKAILLPPNGNKETIRAESRPSFLKSIHQASKAHNKKTPRKPDRKAFTGACLTKTADRNAVIAKLHQGRYNPATNVVNAVSNMATNIFI